MVTVLAVVVVLQGMRVRAPFLISLLRYTHLPDQGNVAEAVVAGKNDHGRQESLAEGTNHVQRITGQPDDDKGDGKTLAAL